MEHEYLPVFEIFLDNEKQYFKAPVVRIVLSFLKRCFGGLNDEELGKWFGFEKYAGNCVSRIRTGDLTLKMEHLQSIAKGHDKDLNLLKNNICKRLLCVEDESRRNQFLAGLQIATSLTFGLQFDRAIGNENKDLFLKTGRIPLEWMNLIPDRQTFIRLISVHCVDPINISKKGSKPRVITPQGTNGKIVPSGDEQNPNKLAEADDKGENLPKNPEESPTKSEPKPISGNPITDEVLMNASFAAGRASVMQLSLETFMGALAKQLKPNFSVTFNIAEDDDKFLSVVLRDTTGNCFVKEVNIERFSAN